MANNDHLIKVMLETDEGVIIVGVDVNAAPLSASRFLDYVEGGHLNNAPANRIVNLENQTNKDVQIEVVQWGWLPTEEHPVDPFNPIPHEPTVLTGLKHLDGTLSMGRNEIGTAGPEYFFCIGDQPSLNFGGDRNPDGHGFAAFGKILEGYDVLLKLYKHASPTSEYPDVPPRFKHVTRI